LNERILMASASAHPPSGEMAAKIRVAAQEAVKHLPGVVLGDGQINEIIRQTGSDQLALADRLTRAASLAADIARSYSSKPVNYHSATTAEVDQQRAAMGLLPLQRGAHSFLHRAADRDAGKGSESGGTDRPASSAAYGRAFLGGAGDPAFLRSMGLSDTTGKALGALGFRSPEQVRQIVGDAKTLGLAPNTAALELGRLRKAEGDRTNEHVAALKRYGDGLRALTAEEREIAKIKDPVEKRKREQAHAAKRSKREEELSRLRKNRLGRIFLV
jgi:hypothetical protein